MLLLKVEIAEMCVLLHIRGRHKLFLHAYGTEVFTAMQLQVQEPATLTMRYSALIRPDCLIYKLGDPVPYEIISVNDVEDRHCWLEVKVRRMGAAR